MKNNKFFQFFTKLYCWKYRSSCGHRSSYTSRDDETFQVVYTKNSEVVEMDHDKVSDSGKQVCLDRANYESSESRTQVLWDRSHYDRHRQTNQQNEKSTKVKVNFQIEEPNLGITGQTNVVIIIINISTSH